MPPPTRDRRRANPGRRRVCPVVFAGTATGMTANPLPAWETLDVLDYPVSKEDLIRRAQEIGASTETLQSLRSLPVEEFDSPAHIGEAIADLG
jgi:hypothetical protein